MSAHPVSNGQSGGQPGGQPQRLPKRRPQRRIVGRVLRGAAWVVAGVSVLIGVVFGALQLAPVRAALADSALAAAAQASGLTYEIDGYRGLWPLTIGADTLRVRDGAGLIAELEEVDLAWAPLDLLRGTVRLPTVAAERVSVYRLPAAPADAPSGAADTGPDAADTGPGLSLPDLPVAIRLERLSLPRIDIAAAVTGATAIALALHGHASLAEARADLALDVHSHDAGPFSLNTALTYAAADGTLAFDLALVDGGDAAPGLIAMVTGDAALSPVRLTAKGAGPIADWQAEARGTAGSYGTVAATARGSRRRHEPLALAFTATPGPARDTPPPAFAATLVLVRGADAFTLNDMTVSAGPARFAGQVHLAQPLAAPRLLLEGDLLDVADLDLTWLGYTGPALAALPRRIAVEVDVAADAAFTHIDVAQARLAAPGYDIAYQGRVDVAAGAASGTAHIDIADVAPLAALAGVEVAGSLSASLDVTRATTAGMVAGALDATFQPTRLPVAAPEALLADTLVLDMQVADAGGGITAVERFNLGLQSGAFTLAATGLMSPAMLDLAVDASVPQLAAFAPLVPAALTGAAGATVALSGSFDAPVADATLTMRDARAAGVPLSGDATASLQLAPIVEGPIGFIGRIADRPATASARLRAGGGETQIAALTASLLDIDVVGDVAVRAGGALYADIAGKAASLAPLGQVIGTPMQGAGDFAVVSAPTDAGTQITAEARFSDVAALGVAAGSVLVRGGVSAQGDVDAQARIGALDVAHIQVGTAAVEVNGLLEQLALTAELEQIATGGHSGHLSLAAEYAAAARTVTVARLEGALGEDAVRLTAPTTVSLARGLEVAPVQMAIADGVVRAAYARTADTLAATLAADRLPIRFLARAAGQTGLPGGTVDATLDVSGRGTTGAGQARIALAPRTTQAEYTLPGITLDGRWDGATASVAVTVDAQGADDLVMTAALPVAARQGIPYVAAGAPLDAQLRGTADLAGLWPLVAVDGSRVRGALTLDVAAQGPLTGVTLSGSAQMRDGLYENYDTGLVLSPLTASLDATPFGGSIELAAGDGNGGTLQGRGTLDLRDTTARQLDAALTFSSFRVLRRDEVSATASGDIALVLPQGAAGDGRRLRVDGRINVDDLRARIPDASAAPVQTIDVIKVTADGTPVEPVDGDGAQARRARRSGGEPPLAIDLDIAVNVPGPATVRGRGLESNWQGNLTIGGTADTPDVQGTFEVTRGSFSLLSRKFDVTGGRITFTGGAEIDPLLNVTAVYEEGSFTAIVSIAGPASDPTIEISSRPALAESEVLSRVLFGEDSSQLSAFQAVQLAQAAGALSGDNFGSGRVLGLDVDVGDQGLEVGSYVTDRVYFGASQGLDADTGRASLKIDLTGDLAIESGVGSRGDTSVGLFWGRDY